MLESGEHVRGKTPKCIFSFQTPKALKLRVVWKETIPRFYKGLFAN